MEVIPKTVKKLISSIKPLFQKLEAKQDTKKKIYAYCIKVTEIQTMKKY